jgi:hypothetical protein
MDRSTPPSMTDALMVTAAVPPMLAITHVRWANGSFWRNMEAWAGGRGGIGGSSTALAAAIAAGEALEKHGLNGTIRFYGTPAEENFSGKDDNGQPWALR